MANPVVIKKVSDSTYCASLINSAGTLVDGKEYDQGAVVATYNAKYDCFMLGNCFIPRSDTIYSS